MRCSSTFIGGHFARNQATCMYIVVPTVLYHAGPKMRLLCGPQASAHFWPPKHGCPVAVVVNVQSRLDVAIIHAMTCTEEPLVASCLISARFEHLQTMSPLVQSVGQSSPPGTPGTKRATSVCSKLDTWQYSERAACKLPLPLPKGSNMLLAPVPRPHIVGTYAAVRYASPAICVPFHLHATLHAHASWHPQLHDRIRAIA